MNNTLALSNMVPICSTFFPGTITGYGRIFLTKLPRFMEDYLSHFKHIDSFKEIIDSRLPSIDNMFNEYRYSAIRCDSIKQIRPEDIHFPEGMKRNILKSKEKGSLLRGLTSKISIVDESEDLYDWLSKQDEATKALIMQPGPKWWECGHGIQPFNPYET